MIIFLKIIAFATNIHKQQKKGINEDKVVNVTIGQRN